MRGDIRLTSVEHWARRGGIKASDVDIGTSCWFRQHASIFRRFLGHPGYSTIVEIGAYPGHVLDWARRCFGLRASAIEYVPSQAHALAAVYPDFEVLAGDFLSSETFVAGRTWDVVFSLGLVEHWSDPRVPIARHAAMTSPGGTCIVGIPLHCGLYGEILRHLDPTLREKHSGISEEDLRKAFEACVGPGWSIEFCGAIEGAGFWNCGLKEWAGRRGLFLRLASRAALGVWHRTATRLPAPASLRPNALLVARRHPLIG
jgi:hypothetical protein